MNKFFFTIFIMFFLQEANAQKKEIVYPLLAGCKYFDNGNNTKLYEYGSGEEGLEVINTIVSAVGLQPNFSVRIYDGQNAMASKDGNTRIIFYNADFLNGIDLKANTNWASVSILAHEVGHHLNGHALDERSGSSHDELEADEFSGYVLHKLGASLQQAEIAAIKYLPVQGSSTHPPRSARLQAIEKGWSKDEPVNPESENFREFIKSLPQTIYAKPKNGYTDKYRFSGDGSFTLSAANNKYVVNGSLDFDILQNDIYKHIEGKFSGTSTWNMYTRVSNYPITESINLNGKIILTTKKGTTTEFPFTSIQLRIESPDFISVWLNSAEEGTNSADWILAYLNFGQN